MSKAKITVEPVTVEFSVLGRTYKVACPPDQQALLQEAAVALDQRMNAIRAQTDGVGPERAAVMVGLNAMY